MDVIPSFQDVRRRDFETRKHSIDPFSSVKPIIESADVGFTNFEMAVDNNCGLPDDYQVMLGKPSLGSDRPGRLRAEGSYDPLVWEGLLGMLIILQNTARL